MDRTPLEISSVSLALNLTGSAPEARSSRVAPKRETPLLSTLALAWHPEQTETILVVPSIAEIQQNIRSLLAQGIRGLIFDDRNTLRTQGRNKYQPEIVEALKALVGLQAGTHNRLKVCLLPEYATGYDTAFLELARMLESPILHAESYAPRPHPIWFTQAADALNLTHAQCGTVSDRIVSTAKARELGMRQILTNPLEGMTWPHRYEREVKARHDVRR